MPRPPVSLLGVGALFAVALHVPAPRVTLFLAGDSTMAPKHAERRPETGWGEMLGRHLDTSRVVVRNHAVNGRSTRSFIAEGRWRALTDGVRAGDYVFVQFGHNDESPDKGDRYAPPAEFRRNLERMVGDVRARGATPVLLTPVVRRRFDAAGALIDTHGEYPDIVRAVAAAHRVALVDAERETRALLRRLGPDSSRALFLHLQPGEHPNYPTGASDDTHFSERGAREVAAIVSREIRSTGLGLAAFLRGVKIEKAIEAR
jgi:lysophospholipase L1-like esterase